MTRDEAIADMRAQAKSRELNSFLEVDMRDLLAWLAALTPPAVELSEQAGGKDARFNTRPCTCLGTCKGSAGLGERWHCVMESRLPETEQDVHTEHCCRHGCKYGSEDCSVESGQKPQSFPCEDCEEVRGEEEVAKLVELQAKVNSWEETARLYCQNESFYRDIVYSIGELFGDAAKTSDDGGLQDSVLALKVFPLAQELQAKCERLEGEILQGQLANGDIPRLKTCEAAWLGVVEELNCDATFLSLATEMSHAEAAKKWVRRMVQEDVRQRFRAEGTQDVSGVSAVQKNGGIVVDEIAAESAESQITALQSQLADVKEELGNNQIDREGVLEAIGLPVDAEVALAQAVREWVSAQARPTVENVEGGAQ